MRLEGVSVEELRYRKELAARICEARLVRDLTRVEVARRSGIHKNSLAQYELGVVFPTAWSLDRLARALDVSPGWLLSGPRGKTQGLKPQMICSTKATMGPEILDPEFRNRGVDAGNGNGKMGRA